MRTDIDSMTAGKGMAQASHAANRFINRAHKRNRGDIIKDWENQTDQGFGTVIVLDGYRIEDIIDYVGKAHSKNIIAGVVHDPTYPLVDGEVVHQIPLDTCAYIFCKKEDEEFINSIIGHLPLHA